MYEIAELDVPNHDDFKNQIAALHDAAFAWAVRCSNGDWHEGEEVLQSVYLKVVEGRAVFRKESALKTWLFGVIRNTARERGRKRHGNQRRKRTHSLSPRKIGNRKTP